MRLHRFLTASGARGIFRRCAKSSRIRRTVVAAYSQAVKAGAHLYLSGLVGIDPSSRSG
jgi:enamine deaminase RidA (YjgF/YER057c/UK114 family)